jgi:AraC-like DNA-binding protein
LGHRESILFPDLLGALPTQIHSVGFQEEHGPWYHWTGRNRSNQGLVTINCTLSGRGRLRHVDRQIFVEPGQTMLLHFPSSHHYWIEAGERWEFFYLTLTGRDVISSIREIADKVGPVLTLEADSPTLAHAAEVCADALEHKIESPHHGARLARALLVELLQESRIPTLKATRASRAAPTFVADVEEFCQQNFARSIGVGEMAQVARMSRFHFSRLFRKAWGISPGRYLALLRSEQAMKLARTGEYTVKEMARQCGFSTANYFCKVFRHNFGASPGSLKPDGFLPRISPLTIANSRPIGPVWPDYAAVTRERPSEQTRSR